MKISEDLSTAGQIFTRNLKHPGQTKGDVFVDDEGCFLSKIIQIEIEIAPQQTPMGTYHRLHVRLFDRLDVREGRHNLIGFTISAAISSQRLLQQG